MSGRFHSFLEEFNKHIVNDYGIPYILLKDEALYMLTDLLENWPFLDGAINRHNKYRIHINKDNFEMFFIPALKALYED